MTTLLMREDVVALFATGFGKSMLFTVFARLNPVLVICPLENVMLDQIVELESSSPAELAPESLPKIIEDTTSFIFFSVEQVLEERFLAKYFEQELIHCNVLYFGWPLYEFVLSLWRM